MMTAKPKPSTSPLPVADHAPVFVLVALATNPHPVAVADPNPTRIAIDVPINPKNHFGTKILQMLSNRV
jgi:hypothetical protein